MAAPETIVKTSFLQTIDIGLRGLLFNKFGDILNLETVKEGVILYPKEIALREMAERKDQVELEFMNLWRTQVTPDWKYMKSTAARRGMQMEYVDAATKTDIAIIKSIPVHLEYDLWFWTRYIERLNLIAERYLFWQHSDPNLGLNFDVRFDLVKHAYPVELDLHFGPLIDESTEAQKYDKGTMFVLRTPIKIDGVALIADSVKTIKSITLSLYDKNNLSTDADYSEVIVEDSNQDVELEVALRLCTRTYT